MYYIIYQYIIYYVPTGSHQYVDEICRATSSLGLNIISDN